MAEPLIGIVMGSQSDWETMRAAAEVLAELGVPHEVAHRLGAPHPRPAVRLCRGARPGAGCKVIIAGAGGAAHLPGMLAAKTRLPVLGVPVQSKALAGLDSLLSIVQMPKGVPVGTLAIGPAGAANAGLLAAAMLATADAGARRAARRLARRRRPRRWRRRPMAPERCCRPAAASASSAAASSGGCWRWPRRGSACAPTSSSRRPTPARRRSRERRDARGLRRLAALWPPSPARSTSSPTSSRTSPLARGRRAGAAGAGAARAAGAGGGAGPAGEKAFLPGSASPTAPYAAVDGPEALAAALGAHRHAGDPEDPAARL